VSEILPPIFRGGGAIKGESRARGCVAAGSLEIEEKLGAFPGIPGRNGRGLGM